MPGLPRLLADSTMSWVLEREMLASESRMLPPTCGLGLPLGEDVSLPGALMALGTERRETGDLSLMGKEAMDALREALALVFPLLTFSTFRFFDDKDLDREVEAADGIKWRQPDKTVSVCIAYSTKAVGAGTAATAPAVPVFRP